MLAMPAGIPAGMVADAPVLRIPCLRAPLPEPIVRRQILPQPLPIEYPQDGGLWDEKYGRPPYDIFLARRQNQSQYSVAPPRPVEHHHMQHKVHKSYPRHQRNRSASGSPPRNEPIISSYPPHHGTASRLPRIPSIASPSKYISVPTLQKPEFSLQAHESLLRQAAMRAALHNGNRQCKPVERPVRHPLPTGRPLEQSQVRERGPPVPRQTRRTLSDREKMDICLFHEHHRSFTHKDIADKFGVERTTVTKILQNKHHHLNPMH